MKFDIEIEEAFQLFEAMLGGGEQLPNRERAERAFRASVRGLCAVTEPEDAPPTIGDRVKPSEVHEQVRESLKASMLAHVDEMARQIAQTVILLDAGPAWKQASEDAESDRKELDVSRRRIRELETERDSVLAALKAISDVLAAPHTRRTL
jgi:hypothetical protein